MTMIELLVVISIIILLVTMLLPAYQKVKDSVYATRSKARITELSIGASAYSQASSGLYPGQLYPNMLTGGGGPYTGTQWLAACLFGIPYSRLSLAFNPAGHPDANSLFAPYVSGTGGDLIQAGTGPRSWSIWDKFPRGVPMSFCYYPARLGATGLGQFVEADNTAYTSGTAWLGGSFNAFITDQRLTTTPPTPYNAGSFLLFGPSIDGKYGSLDDGKNFGS